VTPAAAKKGKKANMSEDIAFEELKIQDSPPQEKVNQLDYSYET